MSSVISCLDPGFLLNLHTQEPVRDSGALGSHQRCRDRCPHDDDAQIYKAGAIREWEWGKESHAAEKVFTKTHPPPPEPHFFAAVRLASSCVSVN